jgi:hypothetical protein
MNARRAVSAAILTLGLGCSTFDPVPLEKVPFRERAQVETRDGVTVSVSVLTKDETRQAFDVFLQNQKIQPVWLKIENRSDLDYVFLMVNLDPEYFSSQETSWMNHFFLGGSENDKMDDHMYRSKIRTHVPAGETVEGFVYTNRDYGLKVVGVHLLSEDTFLELDFVVDIPGLKADFLEVDFDNLYPPDEIVDLELSELEQTLEALPCCVKGGDRQTPGDPLNLVLIADGEDVLTSLAQRGWHLTEKLHAGAVWGTVKSSLFGTEYKTSPISSLYLFDRPQDAGFQKARGTVDQRNHLRLWLSPWRFEGKEIWVGQISRDIGVKLSAKTLVTHEVDPQVDEARDYLAQDLLLSRHVAALAWVKGVGAATPEEPRYNFTRSAYFTDGMRVVILLSDEPTALTEVDFYEWDQPPTEWE